MVVELKRGTHNTRFEPLTWRLGQLVSCSNGHISSLTDHEIATDGAVSPSLVCPDEDCDWHETVRLLDWPPRAVTPERSGGLV